MIAASPVPVIAALIARARRKVAAHFLAQHAIGPEDAVAFVPGRRIERHEFERLRRKGVVREAATGRFWLDRAALDADTEARRRVAIPIVLLLAAAIPLLFYPG